MPLEDTLTPQEAAHIATNAYFTLKNWIHAEPIAATERRKVIQKRVLGAGNVGSIALATNPTLRGTGLMRAQLGRIHPGDTGLRKRSGFGYTLTYRGVGRTHAILAMRGTRPELAGNPDVLTDARGSMAGFSGYGPVHKGFLRTYESVMRSVALDASEIEKADVVHCVGHSLGGALATLMAAGFAASGRRVKLYTFGSPRVAALGTYAAMEQRIGVQNIYRVAHDLDPISLLGPFPYIHVIPSTRYPNFMTIPSPSGSLFSTTNHDMQAYIQSAGLADASWEGIAKLSSRVEHQDFVLARWLLHEDNNPGWVQFASARTLAILFRLFRHVLAGASTSGVLGLTALDFLAELLMKGMHTVKGLGEEVVKLLGHTARWAGIQITSAASFTAEVIQKILVMMLSMLRGLASGALGRGIGALAPVPLVLSRAWELVSSFEL